MQTHVVVFVVVRIGIIDSVVILRHISMRHVLEHFALQLFIFERNKGCNKTDIAS